jgi:hypothetical protein
MTNRDLLAEPGRLPCAGWLPSALAASALATAGCLLAMRVPASKRAKARQTSPMSWAAVVDMPRTRPSELAESLVVTGSVWASAAGLDPGTPEELGAMRGSMLATVPLGTRSSDAGPTEAVGIAPSDGARPGGKTGSAVPGAPVDGPAELAEVPD